MAQRTKVRYEIDLTVPVPDPGSVAASVRSVSRQDLEGLASLMLDSYKGTIDYEGEELDEAAAEVREYLDGDPLLDHSYVAEVGGVLASAVLVMCAEGTPMIRSVMTLPTFKGSGFARLVTISSMSSLASDGYRRLVLYITRGNTPSEALFRSVGALRHPDRGSEAPR